ncbi:MAG: Gfo/Idh/MocA family protein [Chroococcales cyanobacterium]
MTQIKTSPNFAVNAPVKVGIVGTGYAATKRAEAFQAEARARLVAVSGHTPESTQRFAEARGALPVNAWEELVKMPELDLVVICTVNRDHGAIARTALNSGKHVIVEYPLALNLTEAEELVTLSQQQGKLLHVEHIELIGGLHQAMREVLPEIGPVFYARYITVNAQRPVPQRWSYNHHLFGFPLSAALSRINRLIDLFGTVASVNGYSRFWNTTNDYYKACLCQAQLQFTSGLRADVIYGKGETFWRKERTFEIHGEEGTLVFEGEKGTLIRGEEKTAIAVEPRRGLFTKDTAMVLDYLIEGTPLYIHPNESVYALKVADAARRSAELGQVIQI